MLVTTLDPVFGSSIERRLRKNVRRLEAARADLAVTAEQLLSLADDAEDLRIRALVSDDLRNASDHREADRHRRALQRHHDELREEITRLETEQDELLDRMQDRG